MAILMRIYEKGSRKTLLELDGLRLQGSDVSGRILRAADLHSADLRGSLFSRTNLAYADMHNADARFVDFTDACLEGADMRKIKLGFACLGGADLRNAIMLRADLEGAIYDLDTFWPSGVDPRAFGAYELGKITAAAICRVYSYASENGLSLMSEVYHDVPVITLRRRHGQRAYRISIAVYHMDNPSVLHFAVMEEQSILHRSSEDDVINHFSIPLDVDWDHLRSALDTAIKMAHRDKK